MITPSKKDFISVIVPAAGMGTRMGKKTKKQFLPLSGKPILHHTLNVLEHTPLLQEIILVLPTNEIEQYKNFAAQFPKISRIVTGGKERQNSVKNGLDYVSPKATMIFVHDGVRPFIQESEIKLLINALKKHDAVALAVPLKDTTKRVSKSLFVKKTLDRGHLWSIQTPQGMKAHIFREIYKKLKHISFLGTDESMLAEHFQIPVKIIRGSYYNIKITTTEDLHIAKAIYSHFFP